jgi:molybdate transport system regulatory protein
MKKFTIKIRISNGHETVIGPGKADLLQHIIDTGSISTAAKKMNMSYRRAWELINTMNQSFDEPIVITKTGGIHGGGAEVSDFGIKILSLYKALIQKMLASADEEITQIYSHIKSWK